MFAVPLFRNNVRHFDIKKPQSESHWLWFKKQNSGSQSNGFLTTEHEIEFLQIVFLSFSETHRKHEQDTGIKPFVACI